MADHALPPFLAEPVWFDRLREPTWLLPRPRGGATRVVVAAVHRRGDPGQELATGLPLYVSEAVRFATEAETFTATATLPPGAEDRLRDLDADVVVTMLPSGGPEDRRLRFRVETPSAVVVDDDLPAAEGAALAETLADLPRRATDAVRATGVAGTWAPAYVPPVPAQALRYLQAHRACLELGDERLYPSPHADPEIVSARRTVVKALLGALADVAQRVHGAFPTMLYFAGLAGAQAHGSSLPLEFRLQTNALCMEASDARDIVYRLSVLALRLQGDVHIAERRSAALAAMGDDALAAWLRRVDTIR
jgi:hypothetical protein